MKKKNQTGASQKPGVKVSIMLISRSHSAVGLEMKQLAFAMQEKFFPLKSEAKAISKNNHA